MKYGNLATFDGRIHRSDRAGSGWRSTDGEGGQWRCGVAEVHALRGLDRGRILSDAGWELRLLALSATTEELDVLWCCKQTVFTRPFAITVSSPRNLSPQRRINPSQYLLS